MVNVGIKAPDVAENGAVIPMMMFKSYVLPGKHVDMFVNNCGIMRVYNNSSQASISKVATRVKAGSGENILAAKISDHPVVYAKQVNVTIGSEPCKNQTANQTVAYLPLISRHNSKTIRIRAKRKGNETVLKALITHPMETGARRHKRKGSLIPAHYITDVFVDIEGRRIATFKTTSAISKNPYFSFATNDGLPGDRITLTWRDSANHTDSHTTRIK